jgi:hypothetical protein
MGGSKQQTSSTNSEPWAAAQPALQMGLNDAQAAYKSGIGSQPYTGSTVVPYAKQTTQGMQQLQTAAKSTLPSFYGNFNAISKNVENNGLNDLQRGAINRLTPMADGSMLNANPYIDKVIGNSARDIAGASNLMASSAGRYGSGAHQNVTEKNIGDMSSNLRYQNYGDERGRQMDAIGSLFNAGQAQQGNINANTGALADAYQAMQMPSQSLMDVGGMNEDLYGRQLNDQLRVFSETQSQPWNQIARLNAIASGAGSMGRSSQATAQGPSRLSSGLGGAIGGGTLFGPLGAIGGGLLGAFS